MSKLDFLDSYIKRCDEVIVANDYNAAKILQTQIISTFENEIKNIKSELDNYSMAGLYESGRRVDFLGDLRLLKQKLENYHHNIQEEEKRRDYELELARLSQPVISASAEATQTVNNTIKFNVSICEVVDKIDGISADQLSNCDKEKIKEYLYSLEGIKATKDKNKFWNKAKELLKYLLDKGIEVGIAVLPYILGGLQQ